MPCCRSIVIARFLVQVALVAGHVLPPRSTAFLEEGTRIQEFTPEWFTQKVDHFHPEDDRVFQQKYYVNDNFFRSSDAPIFLYISGEAPLYGPPKEGSFVDRLAKRHGALLIALEHRFYGESIPFDQLTSSNLEYLSTRQVLLDIAAFRLGYVDKLNARKSALPSDVARDFVQQENAWFTFGGSYAGALAAWFRLKFPRLTRGSLASSAVLESVIDYVQFDEQVGRSVGSECADAMRRTTRDVDKKLDKSDHSNVRVKTLFGAPDLDDGDFSYLLADSMAMAVQYGFKNHICNALLDAVHDGSSRVHAFANYTHDFFYPTLEHGGPNEYSTSYLAQVESDPERSGRQWWYQKCSELGLFQTAPAIRPIRSRRLDVDYHRAACAKMFGEGIWPDPDNFNKYYGGRNLDAGNIYFVNGIEDPWQHISITSPVSMSEPARLVDCEGCGHCVDLKTPTPNDPPELVATRQDIDKYISAWLSIG